MPFSELRPQSPSYCGNRSIGGLERVLPAVWLSSHEFRGDEVEVYTLGEALVLLPSRQLHRGLGPDFFEQVTVGWAPVEWWRLNPSSPRASIPG